MEYLKLLNRIGQFKGVSLIDVDINKLLNDRLIDNVDFDQVKEHERWITHVPIL
jgi:5,10-methylene-tetrahydrofolate dehydrogenase/methenyl tetrahydrofolate cyclohydrolase